MTRLPSTVRPWTEDLALQGRMNDYRARVDPPVEWGHPHRKAVP